MTFKDEAVIVVDAPATMFDEIYVCCYSTELDFTSIFNCCLEMEMSVDENWKIPTIVHDCDFLSRFKFLQATMELYLGMVLYAKVVMVRLLEALKFNCIAKP